MKRIACICFVLAHAKQGEKRRKEKSSFDALHAGGMFVSAIALAWSRSSLLLDWVFINLRGVAEHAHKILVVDLV